MKFHLRIEKGFMPKIQASIDTRHRTPALQGRHCGVANRMQRGIANRRSAGLPSRRTGARPGKRPGVAISQPKPWA